MFLSGYRALTFTDYSPAQLSEGLFGAPTTFLVPGATLYVFTVRYYFHAVIAPESNDQRNIAIVHNTTTPPATSTLRLLNTDWESEGFRNGDIVAVRILTDTCGSGQNATAICRISEIRGNSATMVVLHGSIFTPLVANFAFYGYILLVRPAQPDFRKRKEEFVAKVARFGDVESEISPLSGLRWSEPHADAIFVGINDVVVGSETLLQPSPVFCTSPFSSTWITQVLPPINALLATTPFSSLAPIENFREVRVAFTHSHLYYYRTQFNTLARSAQRNFFHENAEYIARLIVGSEDREITYRHRVKLLHANIDPRDGVPAPELSPLRPVLVETPTQYIITSPPAVPGWSINGYYFALLGPDEHHKSTRIGEATGLTNFTYTGAINSINKAAFLSNIRRNPFETFVFGGVIYQRFEPADNITYYACLLTDVLPADVDFGIDFNVNFFTRPDPTHPNRPNYILGRFNTLHVRWSQPASEFEYGEWQVFLAMRDPNDPNKPSILVQTYTMKVTEDNLVINTPAQKAYYTLHYALKYFVNFGLNLYFTNNYDVSVETVGSNVIANFLVPIPGFDQPQARSATLRPASGSLFDWAQAYGATISPLRPGVQVANVELRVFLYSPSGKVYATPWEPFRIKSPEQSNAFVLVNNETTFIVFRLVQNTKAAIKLFSESISELKPVWELTFGTGLQTTNPAVGSFVLVPFAGTNAAILTINKNQLPPGCYKLHYLSEDATPGQPFGIGYDGVGVDWVFEFCVGRPAEGGTPIEKKECCYIVPVVQNEQWPYLEYSATQNNYTQTIINPQNESDLIQLKKAYNCCFEYKPASVLREGYIDIIALFNNRYNNIPVSGQHLFRYRGFIERVSDEIEQDSYITQMRETEAIIKTFTKRYTITLFMSDCEVNQLDFQKFAWRWRVRNYTNSLLPAEVTGIVDNIDIRQEYNKAIATITLKEVKQDEFRHRNTA